jgi:ABC-2 type transport system ATP-binding protein
MIEVSGLTKYYGRTRAIHDLSFTIESGRIAGFLGLNAAGKTTALKILAGFLLPTSGNVSIGGIDLVAEPERLRSRIGFLPEKPPLYDEMTVGSYLGYLGRLRGMPGGQIKKRLPEVLELTGLVGFGPREIGTLSLGFRKRVGIAQAIIHDPDLLILDEPISGLDPVQIVEMRKLVRSLGGRHTILISSHILSEVEETCDHLLVLSGGELVAQGTEEQLLAKFTYSLNFQIVIRGDAERAQALLDGCDLVQAAIAGRVDQGLAAFAVTLTEDRPEQLASLLVQSGLGLHRLEPARNQLEQAFVAMTGDTKEGVA